MKTIRPILMVLLAVTALQVSGRGMATAQDDAKKKAGAEADKPVPESRMKQIRDFERLLSGASLVGHFTTDGKESDPAKPDRYTIAKVTFVKGNQFLFIYDHKGVPIPLTLDVMWAGKTPVITLDEFTIPGMGTFSARVMFHGHRYAGTWQHGKVGGLMYGKVDSPALKKKLEEAAAKNGDSKKETDNDTKPDSK